MTSSDHLLFLSVDVASGIEKRRKVSKTPIKYGSPEPEDQYAPAPAGCACVDGNGYQRREHLRDADGRCIFCDRWPAAASYRGKKS